MTDPLPIPVLETYGLRLRPHTMEDLTPVLERCLDPVTQRWTTVPLDYTDDMAKEYIGTISVPSAEQVSWAIEVDGRYAGSIDLRSYGCEPGHGAGNVGFVTHQDFRGRGVMSTALGLVVGHALDTLGWELVVWQGNVGNIGSYKSAWRNGFPVPVMVPALLNHRGVMRDGWHAVLQAGDAREPRQPWPEVLAVLERQLAESRRPG